MIIISLGKENILDNNLNLIIFTMDNIILEQLATKLDAIVDFLWI